MRRPLQLAAGDAGGLQRGAWCRGGPQGAGMGVTAILLAGQVGGGSAAPRPVLWGRKGLRLAADPPQARPLCGAGRSGRGAGDVRGEVRVGWVGATLHHAVGADGRVDPGGELQLSAERRAAEVRGRGEA